MRKVIVRNWQEASDYLAGGRDKNERPLQSWLRLYRVNPTQTDSPIGIRTKGGNSHVLLEFHKDGTMWVGPAFGRTWMQKVINDYNDQGLHLHNKRGIQRYWLPGMGTTPWRKRKCRYCSGSGSVNQSCQGPPICHEIDKVPSYLVETGAPGAHCSHFHTSYHFYGKCQHDMEYSHTYTAQCWRCGGVGQIDVGGVIQSEPWAVDQPMRVKNGALVP